MMRFIIILLSFMSLFFFAVLADPWKNLKQGDQAAQQFLDQLPKKRTEAGTHPFYNGTHPKESKYTSSDLTGKPHSVTQQDPAAQMVVESANTRPHFKIDPQTDPLIVRSGELMKNPLTKIGGEGIQSSEIIQGGADETLVCEESGDDAAHTCKSTLVVKIKEQDGPLQQTSLTETGLNIYAHHRHLLNSWPRECHKHFVGRIEVGQATLKSFISEKTKIPEGQIQSVSVSPQGGWKHLRKKEYTFRSFRFNYSYRPKIKVPHFSWANNCASLEAKVDQDLCYYASKKCSIGKQTRIIEGVSVTRDCWEETFTYNCSYPSKDDCGPLRAKGCVQIGSTCKEKIGNTCVVYTQTYQCKGKSQTKYQITGGQTPFCLDGNCRDQSWEANDEMMSSLSQLSLLKEMQGKMNSIFKGEEHQCSKHILNFKDCCGSGKGWGKSVGLGGCKAEEKLLSKKRKARLCHFVGTYCAKKVLGKCIKKKSSYCCFGSKLLKAFHEQGRPQINLGWGSGKHPLCRGFTIEEIQRIDFSKLDLSEVFEDLMKNYQPNKLQGLGQKVGEKIEVIKKGLSPTNSTPKAKQTAKQRKEA